MSCCGAVRANTADTASINLSGTGSISNPIVGDVILDPAPDNQLVINAGGLFAPCQPDLYVDGGVPPGSIAPVAGVNFGGNPLLPNGCGPLMDLYGPQADVLLTNTTDCSFAIGGSVSPAVAYFALDPGASFSLGWVTYSPGINLPPVPIPLPTPFNGGVNETNNAAVAVCGVTAGNDQELTPSVVLAPGDFIWASCQAVLYITGAGPSTSVAPILGTGPQFHLRGFRQ